MDHSDIRARQRRDFRTSARSAKRGFALIELLLEEPIPDGAVRMRRYNNVYRLRLGTANYRLVYRVDRRRRMIEIFRIRPRGTVCRGRRGPE
ncbi:MAG: type II toxin-antitoxin system RelE/ParE family toxin [Acidobacteria bacterium]|nr:type II toxin-antitoxin system RelE/ParE family toxin [Acidobacteriota bacterium]